MQWSTRIAGVAIFVRESVPCTVQSDGRQVPMVAESCEGLTCVCCPEQQQQQERCQHCHATAAGEWSLKFHSDYLLRMMGDSQGGPHAICRC